MRSSTIPRTTLSTPSKTIHLILTTVAPRISFGLSYRSGFSVETWVENSPYAVDPPVVEPAQGHRTAYPTDLGGGEARDVSNYAKDGFEPVPGPSAPPISRPATACP
jgi:hypothetical protein